MIGDLQQKSNDLLSGAEEMANQAGAQRRAKATALNLRRLHGQRLAYRPRDAMRR